MTNEEVAKQIDPEVDEKELVNHTCPGCYGLDNSMKNESGYCSFVDCYDCWKFTARINGKKVIAVINGVPVTVDALPSRD